MAYNGKCPDCGCNLDPGEKCDCQDENKKRGRPAGTETTSGKSPENTISEPGEKSNAGNEVVDLKTLRTSKNLSAKEMVAEVRKIYPKYDKVLQSKCEHGDVTGIELRKDAMNALVSKFAPELQKKKKDFHRLTRRISVRLENDVYDRFVRRLAADGYATNQDCLTALVNSYISGGVKL